MLLNRGPTGKGIIHEKGLHVNCWFIVDGLPVKVVIHYGGSTG